MNDTLMEPSVSFGSVSTSSFGMEAGDGSPSDHIGTIPKSPSCQSLRGMSAAMLPSLSVTSMQPSPSQSSMLSELSSSKPLPRISAADRPPSVAVDLDDSSLMQDEVLSQLSAGLESPNYPSRVSRDYSSRESPDYSASVPSLITDSRSPSKSHTSTPSKPFAASPLVRSMLHGSPSSATSASDAKGSALLKSSELLMQYQSPVRSESSIQHQISPVQPDVLQSPIATPSKRSNTRTSVASTTRALTEATDASTEAAKSPALSIADIEEANHASEQLARQAQRARPRQQPRRHVPPPITIDASSEYSKDFSLDDLAYDFSLMAVLLRDMSATQESLSALVCKEQGRNCTLGSILDAHTVRMLDRLHHSSGMLFALLNSHRTSRVIHDPSANDELIQSLVARLRSEYDLVMHNRAADKEHNAMQLAIQQRIHSDSGSSKSRGDHSDSGNSKDKGDHSDSGNSKDKGDHSDSGNSKDKGDALLGLPVDPRNGKRSQGRGPPAFVQERRTRRAMQPVPSEEEKGSTSRKMSGDGNRDADHSAPVSDHGPAPRRDLVGSHGLAGHDPAPNHVSSTANVPSANVPSANGPSTNVPWSSSAAVEGGDKVETLAQAMSSSPAVQSPSVQSPSPGQIPSAPGKGPKQSYLGKAHAFLARNLIPKDDENRTKRRSFMDRSGRASGAAHFVAQCIRAVDMYGLESEGIYRKSGGAAQTRAIARMLERECVDDVDASEFTDIDAVASALKGYLRNMEEPLLTYGLYDEFIAAASEKEGAGGRVQRVVRRLPEEQAGIAGLLFEHLRRVTEHGAVNRMTATSLGVVFGPTLLRAREASRDFADMGAKCRVVEALVDVA